MNTWEQWKAKGIQGRLEATQRGENPTLVTRMQSGFAVMGDHQFLPGYSLLIAYPVVDDLEALALEHRLTFLRDMSLLGQAVTEVCNPLRMNYSIYGNYDPFLHAHVRARYAWKNDGFRKGPFDRYPAGERNSLEVAFSEDKHGELRDNIRVKLRRLMTEAGTVAGES